jgi:hypothetical protein
VYPLGGVIVGATVPALTFTKIDAELEPASA